MTCPQVSRECASATPFASPNSQLQVFGNTRGGYSIYLSTSRETGSPIGQLPSNLPSPRSSLEVNQLGRDSNTFYGHGRTHMQLEVTRSSIPPSSGTQLRLSFVRSGSQFESTERSCANQTTEIYNIRIFSYDSYSRRDRARSKLRWLEPDHVGHLVLSTPVQFSHVTLQISCLGLSSYRLENVFLPSADQRNHCCQPWIVAVGASTCKADSVY